MPYRQLYRHARGACPREGGERESMYFNGLCLKLGEGEIERATRLTVC